MLNVTDSDGIEVIDVDVRRRRLFYTLKTTWKTDNAIWQNGTIRMFESGGGPIKIWSNRPGFQVHGDQHSIR